MNGQKENIDDLDITGLINVGNLSLPIIFDFTNDLQLESPLPLIPNTRNSPIKNLEDTGDKERDQINELLTSKISNVSIGNIEENDDNERDQTYRNIPNVPSENMEKNDDDVQEQTYGSIGRHSTPVKSLIIPPMMTPEQNQTGARPPLIAMNFSQDKNSSCIPTPFKKSLFWPESKTEKETRKQREKIPAVTTSLQWQQYFEKKEENKRQEEELKLKRKLEREKKSVQNENKKKKAKNDVSVRKRGNQKKEAKRIKKILLRKTLPSRHHQKLPRHGTVLYVIQIDKLRCVCVPVAINITTKSVLD